MSSSSTWSSERNPVSRDEIPRRLQVEAQPERMPSNTSGLGSIGTTKQVDPGCHTPKVSTRPRKTRGARLDQLNGHVPVERHTGLPVSESGGESPGRAAEQDGDQVTSDSGRLPREPESSRRDRKRSVDSPCASIPPQLTRGPPSAAMTPLPEADALTAGPPLAHAHWSPTAAGSR